MRKLFTLLIICLHAIAGAQPLQQVAHLPSTEVYDMLMDKKGFIWVAHNLGVSRYDGINFTNFSNPSQTSLSMTDLVEDKYGRIWCHNFNSQVFYIKDDKMVYLDQYDFTKESIFPRMALYKDELLITSMRGLFVCDINTLKCRYITGPKGSFATTSLCVINDKALLFGAPRIWAVYTKSKGVQRISGTDMDNDPEEVSSALQPDVFNQTVFNISFHSNTVYGLTLTHDNRLRTTFKKAFNGTVNTVSVVHGQPWVHTKTGSYSLDGRDSIMGYNVSGTMMDKRGNTWFCSLSGGLFAQYKNTGWQYIGLAGISGKDYIKCIQCKGTELILCSQYGRVFMSSKKNSSAFDLVYTVPATMGTMESMQALNDSDYALQMSHSTYVLNVYSRQVKLVSNYNIKGIVINGDRGYLSMASSLKIEDVSGWALHNKNDIVMPFSINKSLVYTVPNGIFLAGRPRSRGVLFDTASNCLLVAFADGLQQIQGERIETILYNGRPLYVSSMVHYKRKIYAATFGNGLFVIDSGKVEKAANNSQSVPDAIVRIKRCNNHIWLFRTHDIEVLDADKNEFVHIYPFPVDAPDVTDVEEDSANIYLSTNYGLYSIPWSVKDELTRVNPILLYTLINNTDTVYNGGIRLASNKNNILFKLAVPIYKNADQLHFKYRIINGDAATGEDSVWYYTQDAQREIQFNALKPGSYKVQIIAVKDNEVISIKPLVYQFTIDQPWYTAWWVYLMAAVFTGAIFFAVYQYRLRQVFKIERIRRKISNDLHDDIGSTLSSINVYSQLAKTGGDNMEYIETIQTNAVSVINSLDDLVWNINPKNDALENIINRMRLFALPLCREKDIECVFKVKVEDLHLPVAPNVRADIFMLFKEMINNVIKHAACGVCSIYIIQKGKRLRLTVKDDGRGFNIKNVNPHRNGLRIMGERVKDIKGRIDIHSIPGSGTQISVNCRLNSLDNSNVPKNHINR